MNVIYSAKDAGINCLAYSGRAIEKQETYCLVQKRKRESTFSDKTDQYDCQFWWFRSANQGASNCEQWRF